MIRHNLLFVFYIFPLRHQNPSPQPTAKVGDISLAVLGPPDLITENIHWETIREPIWQGTLFSYFVEKTFWIHFLKLHDWHSQYVIHSMIGFVQTNWHCQFSTVHCSSYVMCCHLLLFVLRLDFHWTRPLTSWWLLSLWFAVFLLHILCLTYRFPLTPRTLIKTIFCAPSLGIKAHTHSWGGTKSRTLKYGL